MEQLKTLQRQFESAADQFPGMIHCIKRLRMFGVIKIKYGSKPKELGLDASVFLNQVSRKAVETPSEYEPTPEKTIKWWYSEVDPSYGTDFCEIQWLIRPEYHNWDKTKALYKLKTLAENAVAYLFNEKANPAVNSIFSEIGSEITNGAEEQQIQGWLSIVRHLQPTQTIKKTRDKEPAENGKPYFSVVDDVFVQSALACGKLLELMQATRAITDNDSNKKPQRKK